MLRSFAAGVLLVFACSLLFAQRPADQPGPDEPDVRPRKERPIPPQPAIFKQEPFDLSAARDDLQLLQMKKFNVAVSELQGGKIAWENGVGNSDLMCAAAGRVVAAALDIYTQPRDQLVWHKRNVELLRYMEAIANDRLADGQGGFLEAAQIEYRRLDAEIGLLRVERKLRTKSQPLRMQT